MLHLKHNTSTSQYLSHNRYQLQATLISNLYALYKLFENNRLIAILFSMKRDIHQSYKYAKIGDPQNAKQHPCWYKITSMR